MFTLLNEIWKKLKTENYLWNENAYHCQAVFILYFILPPEKLIYNQGKSFQQNNC